MKGVLFAAGLLLVQQICAGTAFAGAYAPAPFTAAEILAKARGAAGDLQPGSYVYVEHYHGGGVDTIETTHENGGDWTEVDKTGPFTSSEGSYHGERWSKNENGIVGVESGFRSKVDPNVLAWEHPDDPKYHVRVLGIERGDPDEYVIEANPPGGSDEYRYYGVKTFHLLKVVTFAKDRYKHVTTYSDYRTVFGRTRWFRWTYGDGRPQNDATDEVISFEKDDGRTDLSVPASTPLYDAGSHPIVLPATFTPAGIIVRVTIRDRGLDFLLDSGASDILLDPGVAHQLGIQPYGRSTETIGGNFDTSLALVPRMSVGPLRMHDVAVELGPMDQQTQNARLVGLLGYDFIASAVLGVDFKKQTVTVYPQASFDPKALGLQPMHVLLDDGVPRVPAWVENVEGWFLVDTGAFRSLLYKNYFEKLPDARMVSYEPSAISAVGGEVDTNQYAVEHFAFGPIVFDSAEVLVPTESTFDMTDYDGIIGRDVLPAYQIFFDYAGQAIYLKPD